MKFNFKLGADVQCKEEQHGKLAGVVVEPGARRITDIIVKEGLLFTQAHVLPLALVQSAFEEALYLSISSHEVDQYPEYRTTVYEHPAAGYEGAGGGMSYSDMAGGRDPIVPMVKEKIHEGIATGHVLLDSGTPVHNLDGSIGKVEHVIADRVSGTITHLVVHRGLIFAERLVIPASTVEDLGAERILIAGANEMLDQFAHYTPESMDRVLAE